MAEQALGQTRPRGLLQREGRWHIDKQIKGVRVYKTLDTTDYQIALTRYWDVVRSHSETIADQMLGQPRPPGLLQRGGVWHIDKQIKGIRVYRTLGTSDYQVALACYWDVVRSHSAVTADQLWEADVRRQLADPRSWIHKTHARLVIRARSAERDCTLTPAQLAEIMLRAQGRCMVTLIPFSDWRPEGARAGPLQPSVDRIDSRLGYTADNCRVVLLAVNLAMRNWGDEVILRISKALVLRHLQQELEEVTQPFYAKKNGLGPGGPNPLI